MKSKYLTHTEYYLKIKGLCKNKYKTLFEREELHIFINHKTKKFEIFYAPTKEIVESFKTEKEAVNYCNKIIIGQFIARNI